MATKFLRGAHAFIIKSYLFILLIFFPDAILMGLHMVCPCLFWLLCVSLLYKLNCSCVYGKFSIADAFLRNDGA